MKWVDAKLNGPRVVRLGKHETVVVTSEKTGKRL